MKLKLKRNYPKVNATTGNVNMVYVYEVTGTKAELDKYCEIMTAGNHTCKDEDGTVLYFTVRAVPPGAPLQISIKGKIYVDTLRYDLAQQMIKQYPGKLGEKLADEILSGKTPVEQVDEPADDMSAL